GPEHGGDRQAPADPRGRRAGPGPSRLQGPRALAEPGPARPPPPSIGARRRRVTDIDARRLITADLAAARRARAHHFRAAALLAVLAPLLVLLGAGARPD